MINALSSSSQVDFLMQSAKTNTALMAAKEAKSGLSEKALEKIDGASKDFESMFLTEMMRPMFEEIKPDEIFGGGKGEEVFKDFMLQEYGKKMTASGGIGLASKVKQEMIRIQETAQNGK